MARQKYNTEVVRRLMADAGCQLLDEYVSCHGKMKCQCSCGRPWHVNLTNFLQGKRCADCGGAKKYTHAEVAKTFSEGGCVLVSPDYKDANADLEYVCSCGTTAHITFASFRKGRRCKKCWYGKVADSMATGIEAARKEFEERGCVLLDTEYVNARIPMKYRCSCGEESKICLYSLKNGNKCRKCFLARNSGESHPRWKVDRERLAQEKSLTKRCLSLLRGTLLRIGVEKSSRSRNLLGYTTSELKAHLASFPDWETLQMTDWDIDHIFPIKAFLEYGVFDLKCINALSNLRPISRSENRKKFDKYDRHEFEKYLKTFNIQVF